MFEWTQRPCSPELCSSPFKMQVADSQEFDINHGKNLVAALNSMEASQLSAENTKFEISKEDNGSADVCTTIDASPQIKSANEQNGLKISRKRGRKAQAVSRKKSQKHRDPVIETNVDSNRLSKANEEQIMNGMEKSNSQNITERGKSKTNMKQMLKTSCPVSGISGVHGDPEAKIVNDSPASQCKQKHGKDFIAKNDARKSQRKRQKLGYVQNILNESSKLKNQTDNNDSLPSSISSLQMDNNKKASSSRLIKSNAKKSKSCNRELRSDKKSKLSSVCISQHKNIKAVQPNERGLCNTDLRDLNDSERGLCNTDLRDLNDSSKDENCSLMNEVVLWKCENHIRKHYCAFCLSSEESEASGELLHYSNGRPVAVDYEGGSSVTHSHKNCTEWAPNVYFEDDVAVNLEAEIIRSRKIKCGFCGLKGAALGCYEKSCRRSFHVPCAKWTSHCRWDMDNFVMLCPVHASSKLPCESSGSQKGSRTDRGQSTCRLNDIAGKHGTARSQNRTGHGSHKKIVLCCSALSVQERDVVSEFERVSKVSILKSWDSSVTHVVASTDEYGACKRTLKVLLGILEGKWILNMEWIKASLKAMEPVNEELYEITVDVHGIKDGPCLGRLRVLNKQPKLFDGYKFYFMADFLPSYKGYLHNLVTAAGGIVLHRKPVSGDQKTVLSDTHQSQTLIIYSLELPDKCDPSKKDAIFSCRQSEAEALANSTGSKVASNLWVLNSIAGCKLQNLAK